MVPRMLSPHAAAAACVALLLTILPLALSQDGTQYPRCPKGGFYPKKVTSPPSRCLDASEYSCCKDCRELWLALRIVSANGTTVLDQISPGLSSILGGKDLKVSQLSRQGSQMRPGDADAANGPPCCTFPPGGSFVLSHLKMLCLMAPQIVKPHTTSFGSMDLLLQFSVRAVLLARGGGRFVRRLRTRPIPCMSSQPL